MMEQNYPTRVLELLTSGQGVVDKIVHFSMTEKEHSEYSYLLQKLDQSELTEKELALLKQYVEGEKLLTVARQEALRLVEEKLYAQGFNS